MSVMIWTRASRFLTRAPLVENRRSSDSSGCFKIFLANVLNCNHITVQSCGMRAELIPVCRCQHLSSETHPCMGRPGMGQLKDVPCHASMPLDPRLNNSRQCLPGRLTSDNETSRLAAYCSLTCDSNKLQSIQTPLPVCCLDSRAAIMAP